MVRAFVGICAAAAGFWAGTSQAQVADYRADFPTQYSESAMGVNLQTGKFRYQTYTFEMGPFQQRRGFGQAEFPFVGSLYQASSGPAGNVIHMKVKLNDLNLVFILASPAPNVSYRPWTAQSLGWNLEPTSNGHVLTDRSGNRYYYMGAAPGDHGSIANGELYRIVYADGSTVDIYGSSANRFYRSNRGYAMLSEANGATSKVCGFNLTLTYASLASSCAGSNYVVSSQSVAGNTTYDVTTTLVDVGGHTSTLYYKNGRLLCATLPDTQTCEFTNSYGNLPDEDPIVHPTKGDQVRKQVDALGRIYTYDYEPPDNPVDNPPVPGYPVWSSATMHDPAGRETSLHFDRGVVVTQQTPEDTLVFSYPSKLYNFTLGTNPVTVDYHGTTPAFARHMEGNLDYAAYNRRGGIMIAAKLPKGLTNPTSAANGSYIFSSNPDLHDCCVSPDVPSIPAGTPVVYQGFLPDYPAGDSLPSGCGSGPADAKLCDKPQLAIDAKGNEIDYTYDPAHGGVLTKTAPADANGVRAQVRFEYAQRYTWVKDAGGGYVHGGDPIWVKTRERTCKTSATITTNGVTGCQGGASDEVVTDYEYGPDAGPNNLLLRGVAVTAGGQTLRTCYGYDANGRKVSETQPAAGLGVCP